MITDYKTAVENIRAEFEDYLSKYNIESIIIGQSGGIDSALTTVLAKPVCDKLGVKLISRAITIVSNKPEEIARAKNIGKYFANDFAEVDLSENFELLARLVAEDYGKADPDSVAYKIRLGNIKARTRMLYLYDLAQANNGMVMSTDNYTELLLGFWTLHGDVGDYGLIQNIWKTEVYSMAVYLAKQMEDKEAGQALLDCVDAVATDGLGITNSDLDQLQASSYAEVDEILIDYLRNPSKYEGENLHPVIERHIRSDYKRENPYNIPREIITDAPAI